jgi:ABC-type polysaccharide/polyol phosphate export permease
MRFSSIIWKEWLVFRSKFLSITLGAIVGPLLYLIAFGWGLGSAVTIDGISYTAFVIPGIIALNAMTNSYSHIATDINLSRIYSKTFESVMIAPVRTSVFALSRITAGALRGLYSAALILLVSLIFGAVPRVDWFFALILVLNCYVFSGIGFIAGILIDSHADMAKLTNFVITPMSLLCGTFFPLDRFPSFLRVIIEVLPLTQAVKGLREGVSAPGSLMAALVLVGYIIVLMPVSIALCKRAE